MKVVEHRLETDPVKCQGATCLVILSGDTHVLARYMGVTHVVFLLMQTAVGSVGISRSWLPNFASPRPNHRNCISINQVDVWPCFKWFTGTLWHIPIGSMVLVYMLTFGVYWWSMSPYIAFSYTVIYYNTVKPIDSQDSQAFQSCSIINNWFTGILWHISRACWNEWNYPIPCYTVPPVKSVALQPITINPTSNLVKFPTTFPFMSFMSRILFTMTSRRDVTGMMVIGLGNHPQMTNIWDNPSHWLIFFKMVKTTNQFRFVN